MNIYELKMKDNKKMQEFCISKINEISNIEYIFNVKSREPGYVSDIKYINFRLGQCKVEREHYTYFLHLLQEEYVNLKKSYSDNIMQLTI